MTRLGLAIARQVTALPLNSMYQEKKTKKEIKNRKHNLSFQKPPTSIAYSCTMTYEGISRGDWASFGCTVTFPYSAI